MTLVWILIAGAPPVCPAAQTSGRQFHVVLQGLEGMVVEDAIKGAIRRLAAPACQLVLDDFRDGEGRTLRARLQRLNQTVVEHLASVYFVDGDENEQCRRDLTIAAYTEPGSRVIFVCGDRFAKQFARRTAGGEILVIHELLHSLGLGENPPTPAQITARVTERCR
jgi:hypothetical protein